MPWSHLNQAALTVSVAHEVGHAVDTDFDVGAAVDAAIGSLGDVLGERSAAWLAWRRELFADVYGALCVGPAHVIALSDYLLTTEDVVKAERVNLKELKEYPPRQLRILFNVKLLEAIGLADVGVGQAWEELYPVRCPDYDDYAADVELVVNALLHTPIPRFGGKPVREVISMTVQEWAEVERRAAMLPNVDGRLPWSATKYLEAAEAQALFRLTFAALALASYQADDPATGAKKVAGVLPKMIGWIPYGTRGPAEDKVSIFDAPSLPIKIDEDGIVIASIPEASGFFAQGENVEDARQNLSDVIEGNVLLALQLGLPIPPMTGVTIEVQDAPAYAA
jgi:predicted RNase H-like HicB family nuclease